MSQEAFIHKLPVSFLVRLLSAIILLSESVTRTWQLQLGEGKLWDPVRAKLTSYHPTKHITRRCLIEIGF